MKNLMIILVTIITMILTSCNFTTPVNVFDNHPSFELIQNYGYAYTVTIPFDISDEVIQSFVDDLRGDNSRIVVGMYYFGDTPYILKSTTLDEACNMVINTPYNKCYVYNNGSGYLDTYVSK